SSVTSGSSSSILLSAASYSFSVIFICSLVYQNWLVIAKRSWFRFFYQFKVSKNPRKIGSD
ncbi:hypothetical protein, partial [Bacteroides congonensis]|uniref:hypothetical protein n=1 Tax=Bacteroides congonensis TaxID=1871006 RepID=UPI00255AE5A0